MNYIACLPKEPDAKCHNCKRFNWTKQKVYVNVKNSKDKACIYMPISLQVKT